MAVGSQYKVNQLAKDLSLKTKDLTDIMAAAGLEVKTQKALEPFELDVIWETLTTSNQIVGIEDYIDGVTGIPSLRKKAAETKSEAKAKGEKPADARAPKSAEKKPEKKAEEKPAVKAEQKKSEAKPETKSEAKPETKPEQKKSEEKKPEKKAEEKKPEQKPAEKQNVARSAGERFESRMSAANEKSKQEKAEKKQEKPAEKKSGRTAIDMRAGARPEGEREVVTVSPKAATRVVDTRGSGAVDLSKYDDTLDNIVPENIREERGGSQKVKKSPAAQNAEKEGGNRQGQKNQNSGGKNDNRKEQKNNKDNRQSGKNDKNNNNKNGKNGKKGGFVPAPAPAPVKKAPVKAEIP
ncbi:MAG: hypothetical protein IJF21_06985, partial [Clostridia bacterium]|nr:hypothetical protein [Clostridia bacterium]